MKRGPARSAGQGRGRPSSSPSQDAGLSGRRRPSGERPRAPALTPRLRARGSVGSSGLAVLVTQCPSKAGPACVGKRVRGRNARRHPSNAVDWLTANVPACPRSSRYWAPGCGDLGGATSSATAATAPSGAALYCECYSPHQFDIAYGIQPLLDSGTDGRGETVTVLVAVPQANQGQAAAQQQVPSAPISVKT